jgi:pimeloyl-ACP methyl ester carboxylesterase
MPSLASYGRCRSAHRRQYHTIVAPDLRGLGLSSKPDGGYDKKNQALDVVGALDALGVRTAEFVTHDIGIMVGFAIAATHPERMSR